MESEYRIEIINTLSNLFSALYTATAAIAADHAYAAWTDKPQFARLVENNPRQQAIRVIEQLEYIDEQDPREIILTPGLLAASAKTIEAIQQLNLAKWDFKKAVVAFKEAKLTFDHPELKNSVEELLNKRNTRTARSLKKYGFARLHLKQCYRQIPMLDAIPQKVSWTWANTRSITRISIAEAEKMLRKRGEDYGIQQQLIKLHTLSADESIAIVQELAPHLRTNIVFAKDHDVERLMLKGSLPLFFPAEAGAVLPEFRAPKAKAITNPDRERRSDQRLDPVPFLPAIRGYRYHPHPAAATFSRKWEKDKY